MPLWEAGLFFGIPAIITIFCVYSVFPYLVKHGFSTFVSYAIVLDIPLTIMLVASLVAYRIEGNPMSWPALRVRFRLNRMGAEAVGNWSLLIIAIFSLILNILGEEFL